MTNTRETPPGKHTPFANRAFRSTKEKNERREQSQREIAPLELTLDSWKERASSDNLPESLESRRRIDQTLDHQQGNEPNF